MQKHAALQGLPTIGGLDLLIKNHKKGKPYLSYIGTRKLLNAIKKSEYPWMYEVSKQIPESALIDLDSAFKRLFSGLSKYPKFKSRYASNPSFRYSSCVKVTDTHIQFPVIGCVNLKEKYYCPTGICKQATVVKEAGRWYVSVIHDVKDIPKHKKFDTFCLGIDVGINTLMTLSDGTEIENPRAYKKHLKRLKFLQRSVSRKKKGSNNRKDAVLKLQRQYKKVANIRKDAIHKATTLIIKKNPVIIAIEDLVVRNMVKNHYLAQSLSDASFGEIRRQLEYKCKNAGIRLTIVPTNFPSTKRCYNCGHKRDIALSERIYVCPRCDYANYRDMNAALNLMEYGTALFFWMRQRKQKSA